MRRLLRNAISKATLISITSVARRRLLKPHRNFEEFTAPLVALYVAQIAKLRIDGLDPKATLATLEAYQSLAAEEAAAEAHLALVRGTRLLQSSQVWSTMLEIYARAQLAARKDPLIKAAIADFATYLRPASSKRKRTASPVTPSSASPSGSTAA
jgi:hypothetical protein